MVKNVFQTFVVFSCFVIYPIWYRSLQLYLILPDVKHFRITAFYILVDNPVIKKFQLIYTFFKQKALIVEHYEYSTHYLIKYTSGEKFIKMISGKERIFNGKETIHAVEFIHISERDVDAIY